MLGAHFAENFSRRNFESNGFVRRRSEEEQLPACVGDYLLLLERAHEAVQRLAALLNVRVQQLEEQRRGACWHVALLGDAVARTTDFNRFGERRFLRRSGSIHHGHGAARSTQCAS